MIKILGYFLLSMPFILMIIWSYKAVDRDAKAFIIIWLLVLAIVGIISLGAILVTL